MRKIRRIVKMLVILIVGYFCFIVALMYHGSQTQPDTSADTMIILGAKVVGNPAEPGTVLKSRLTTAAAYLKEHPIVSVIVTGGQGADETATEADTMKEYLIELGIASERIQVENQSTRTIENLMYAKEKFGVQKAVIVTSDYHLFRSLLLAKRVGIDASGLSAQTNEGYRIKSTVREVLSVTYAFIFDHPK
ncbi:YdcF family protein [Isobaculum melis]|nr:YdcF family protein [Isobaculum melis]